MKLVIGITGSSGGHLGIKLINNIPQNIDLYVVISKNAKYSMELENKDNQITRLNCTIFEDDSIGSSISSGSFKIDKMVIVPCSMNTLAKCSVGICDTLITRTFSVLLKEKKEIVIAPREMPFGTIALENMLKLSNLGVIIAPPIAGYYSDQKTIDDMENFLVGKWLDLLKIENNLFKRWERN